MMNEKGGCCGRRRMKAMQLQLGICIEIGGFNFILKSCEIMFLAPPAMQSPLPHVSIHCITLIYHLPHHVHTAACPRTDAYPIRDTPSMWSIIAFTTWIRHVPHHVNTVAHPHTSAYPIRDTPPMWIITAYMTSLLLFYYIFYYN